MRNLLLYIFFSFAAICLKAQQLDSLYTVWEDPAQTDSMRTIAYRDYIRKGFIYSNTDSAIALAQHLLHFGELQAYPTATAHAYNLLGVASWLKSDFSKALEYYQRSFEIFEEAKDKMGLATSLYNIGLIYQNQSEYSRALSYFQQSLKIREEIRDMMGIAINLNSIGNIYADQGIFPKAIDYYQRSLKIKERLGDVREMAGSLTNIGLIYSDQGEYSQALNYQQQSLEIFEEIKDKRGLTISLLNIGLVYQNLGEFHRALEYYQRGLKISEEMGYHQITAQILNNLGSVYENLSEFPKAFDYFHRGLKISEEIENKWVMALALGNIGILYRKQGDNLKALKYCSEGLSLSQEIGALIDEKIACQCLYDTYKAMGKGNKALAFLEKINTINNSLKTKETSNQLQQMEFTKQVLQDSIATAEKERLAQEAHNDEMAKGTQTRNWSIAGGILALLLAVGFYSRWHYVRKSKAKLQTDKDRSENLLLNILPANIAAELKEKGRADAREFDMVSILFTDFKDFTEQSAKLSAADLVNEINICFEAFDAIMEKYGIEKIKTIGDAYMAAGGLPLATDDSVKNTVLAALEMQQFIGQRKKAMDDVGRPAFEMRVGIHTGPVVAGIVGVKKFQYDIWGDTVNTAARIESAGEIGKVNISQTTYELLKHYDSTSHSASPDFVFASRGMIEAKGKGQVEMYFVSRAT